MLFKIINSIFDNPRNFAPLLRGGGGRISWGRGGESPVTPVLSNNLGNAMFRQHEVGGNAYK